MTSNNAKVVFIHVLRGLAYVILPIGAFLFGHTTDNLSGGYLLSALVGVLSFFLAAGVIIFLHPPKRSLQSVVTGQRRASTLNIGFYLPHLLIVIVLSVIGYFELPRLFLSLVLPIMLVIGPI
jgi:hypothetical protein